MESHSYQIKAKPEGVLCFIIACFLLKRSGEVKRKWWQLNNGFIFQMCLGYCNNTGGLKYIFAESLLKAEF